MPVILWRLEPPRSEPRFEGIVDETPGPVKEFAFRDIRGTSHTLADWADRPGIVLIFLGTECPVSNAYAPEMARLARAYAGRGIVFYGIHCDPKVTVESAAAHASAHDLPFPILLDPDQSIARQVGARVTPEAVLLASDGQVLYRGRIDDLYSPDGQRRPKAQSHELENAIKAVLANEMPAISQSPTVRLSTPAAKPRSGQGRDDHVHQARGADPLE